MICLSFTRNGGRVIVHRLLCDSLTTILRRAVPFLTTSNPISCASVYLKCAYERYVYEDDELSVGVL